MSRHLPIFVFAAAVTATQTFGQGVVFIQDGVTPLPGGGFYDGTIDTEFRAANPTDPQGSNPNISVDQFDGGFQTQGAIRFEDLQQFIPAGLAAEDILFAEFSLWKTSPSASDANITFSRVTRQDTTSGDWWQEDDTWASLGGDLIPDGGGLLNGDPINIRPDFNGGVLEAAPVDPANFADTPARFDGSDFVVLDPNEDPVLASLVYTTDQDSEDVFDASWDGTPEDLARAISLSFFRFDVTEAIRGWAGDTDPNTPGTQPLNPNNFGWAINNDTGDGWDMLSSDANEVPESEFDGLDPFQFRPSLTIIFDDGSAGPLDINKDTVIDLEDFQLFANLIGSELDGPLTTGAPGDFDFDRDVDLDDFKFFKENYPGGAAGFTAALSAASVPEPGSVVGLGLLAVVGGFMVRRRLL